MLLDIDANSVFGPSNSAKSPLLSNNDGFSHFVLGRTRGQVHGWCSWSGGGRLIHELNLRFQPCSEGFICEGQVITHIW